jgi:preprotein translocase subunit SecA
LRLSVTRLARLLRQQDRTGHGATLTSALAAVARRGIQYQHGDEPVTGAGTATAGAPQPAAKAAPATNGPKVGRNDPCWWGSGKKFKRCHGV